ncbi:10391_t:CDS:2, partial [Gigaspora rosea]
MDDLFVQDDSTIYSPVNDTTHISDLEKESEPSVRSQITSSEAITLSLTRFLVATALPLSLVENEHFRKFILEIDPLYKPPSDTVALTLDIWSSKAHDSYLGITCHWLTEDFQIQKILLKLIELPYPHGHVEIYNTVQEVIEDWKLDKKIAAILTDNGANVKAAIEKFDDI